MMAAEKKLNSFLGGANLDSFSITFSINLVAASLIFIFSLAFLGFKYFPQQAIRNCDILRKGLKLTLNPPEVSYHPENPFSSTNLSNKALFLSKSSLKWVATLLRLHSNRLAWW